MSSGESPVNIARLLTTFNIEIIALPDDLKCAQCKSVLKDACQVPCGCRLCRTCIDSLIAREAQFCPGDSQECGQTPLSIVQRDFSANKSIMRLTTKCPYWSCPYECPLADMEGHLRVCPRKSVDCPFRELGCSHGALAAADMGSHMQQESGSHSEMLIGLIAGIKRDMEFLKNKQMRHLENEIKTMKHESKSIKEENNSIIAKINEDMELLKQELLLKDEQGRHLKNKIKSVKDENKSIREENESMKNEIRSIKIENEAIKREKEVLTEEVRRLANFPAKNLERERDERRQSDERASAGISAVTGAVALNLDALGIEMKPVRDDIRSIKEQLDSMRCQKELLLVALRLGHLGNWLIDEDLDKTEWSADNAKTSGKFRGEGYPYTYELEACNSVSPGALSIDFLIWADPSYTTLQWPFKGEITITVAHRDNAKKCMRQTRNCWVNRPKNNQCRYNFKPIIFEHAALKGAGLDLERGVRVSCQIVPGAGQ